MFIVWGGGFSLRPYGEPECRVSFGEDTGWAFAWAFPFNVVLYLFSFFWSCNHADVFEYARVVGYLEISSVVHARVWKDWA